MIPSQLNTEWQGVIQRHQCQGQCSLHRRALCVPGVDAPPDVENFQGIPRNWLVTGNDLENWVHTWLRIFGNRARNPSIRFKSAPCWKPSAKVPYRRKSAPSSTTPSSSSSGSSPPASPCSTSFRKTASSSSTAAPAPARPGTPSNSPSATPARSDGQRVLFLTYNKALTAQLRRIVALRQIERGEVVVRGWEELFLELCALAGKPATAPAPGSPVETIRSFYEIELPRLVLEISRDPALRKTWPAFDALVVDEGQDHDTCWHGEIDSLPAESGGWWHIYQLLLRELAGNLPPASSTMPPSARRSAPPTASIRRF
jgi:hypothetical protein